MNKIFINENNEIRSGWKVCIVLLCYGFLSVLFVVATLAVYFALGFAKGTLSLDSIQSVENIISNANLTYTLLLVDSIGFIIANILIIKLIDRKPLREYGFVNLKKGIWNLTFGLILGALSMGIIFFILLWTNQVSIDENFTNPNLPYSLILGIIIFILVGIREELFSRGYCFVTFMQTGKRWLAVLLSAMIFSVMHSLNPNVSIFGLVNILLVGLLFTYMFLKTNSLWMPIGYHITWNYFQGYIFGFSVSGMPLKGLLSLKNVQKNFLTGGEFGPEGGIVATVVIIIGFAAVWYIGGKKKIREESIR